VIDRLYPRPPALIEGEVIDKDKTPN